jgi:hypothetical protein
MHSGDRRAHIRVVTATTYQKLIYSNIYSFPSRGRLLLRSTTEEDQASAVCVLGSFFLPVVSASIAGYMSHKMDRQGRAECLPQPLA